MISDLQMRTGEFSKTLILRQFCTTGLASTLPVNLFNGMAQRCINSPFAYLITSSRQTDGRIAYRPSRWYRQTDSNVQFGFLLRRLHNKCEDSV